MKNLVLKSLLSFMIVASGAVAEAQTFQMDCVVSAPAKKLRDIFVTTHFPGTDATISYSEPGTRQDEWFGPYAGEVLREEEQDTYSFNDGTVLTIERYHEEDPAVDMMGEMVFGRNGEVAPVSCKWSYMDYPMPKFEDSRDVDAAYVHLMAVFLAGREERTSFRAH